MKNWTKYTLIILVAVAVFIWANIASSPSADENKNTTSIYFLNVGQGDAELIEKGDYQILIDGGPDDKVLTELGKTMPVGDRKIELMILTHPHADHLAGLNQILDRYQVGKVFYSNVSYDSNGYTEFLAKLKSKNISTEVPEIGQKVVPFQNGELTFLWPGKNYEQKTNSNLNNTSEVAKFCYFSHCILFTGDIETDEQIKMFGNALSFESELLKVSHHGSSNGTNQLQLDNIKPKMAVIEVGADNKFGHPNSGVIDLIAQNNIQYYRTDINGTIKFIVSESGIIKK